MYQCPGCGGGLKFDIPSQQLKCEHCAALVDPYSLDAGISGAESSYYDVTVFSCPHCGGEIIGPENSAAEFCSFCGASTVLNSRLSKEKRPNYIIPFRKTKEDCKQAYKSYIGHSFFAPKQLKDPKYIDSFRGIYMPYWAYYIEQKGSTYLLASESHRSGDYVIEDHYNLHMNIDAHYKGLSYDASSSFYDNISDAIAPFDVKDMRAFHPAVISGFYADIADIDPQIYMDDAMVYANSATFESAKTIPIFRALTIKEPFTLSEQNEVFHTICKQTDSAMFPVWFMSYRKGNRIAYATVNGQTGKIAADFPISVGKYFLSSLLIAIPIFLLFSLLFSFTAPFTLTLSAILSLVSSIIYAVQISEICKKDSMVYDEGIMYKQNRRTTKKNMRKFVKKEPKASIIPLIIFIIGFIVPFVYGLYIFGSSSYSLSLGASPLFLLVLLVATILSTLAGNSYVKKYMVKIKSVGFFCSISAQAVAFLMAIFNPVNDIFYYVAVFYALAMIICLNVGIIRKYNILATRELPQFNRNGGDDRA